MTNNWEDMKGQDLVGPAIENRHQSGHSWEMEDVK